MPVRTSELSFFLCFLVFTSRSKYLQHIHKNWNTCTRVSVKAGLTSPIEIVIQSAVQLLGDCSGRDSVSNLADSWRSRVVAEFLLPRKFIETLKVSACPLKPGDLQGLRRLSCSSVWATVSIFSSSVPPIWADFHARYTCLQKERIKVLIKCQSYAS